MRYPSRSAPTTGACAGLAAMLLAMLLAGPGPASAQPTVIELTQVPCQFVESEGTNRGYKSRRKADCEAINAASGAARAAQGRPLQLAPGSYTFRVTNQGVPYELGFWLRGATLASRLTLPSVSGGGLETGKTQDYTVTLEPGEYVYSCPLNTTPDYKLTVR